MMLLKQYMQDTLGTQVQTEPIPKQKLSRMPMYIGAIYRLFDMILLDQPLTLAEPREKTDLSILQTEKHFDVIKNILGNPFGSK